MTFIDSWDQGGLWDSGLDWDVNIGPNLGDVTPYLRLVTSEYNQQPNFMTMIGGTLQAFADLQAVMATFTAAYDLDTAVGSQQDVVGQWVGATRNIAVPITGVFFSWATTGLGWGQGNWVFPPLTQLSVLNDADYLTLLRATIQANRWDGTVPGAYEAFDKLFVGTGIDILIQDYQDMSIAYALTGTPPTAVTFALLTGGYLGLAPAGVRVRGYYTPAIPDTPYFGWGAENSVISGWGVGSWGILTPGT